MRLIDADELMEHVYRDRLDSRERIAQMIKNAPTIEPQQKTQGRQRVAQKRRYTFGNDEFSLEAAYHDCKLVFDGITDDDSFQEADTGLILYYANEIIYALQEALPSIQPEQKTGKWIYGEHDIALHVDGYYCNRCNFFVPWDYKHKAIDFIREYKFCPNCSAQMEVEG